MQFLDDELKLEVYNLLYNNLINPTEIRAEMRAHCPFHEDKIPSLQINFEKGVFYCHSVHCPVKKGNFYTLYRQLTGMAFQTQGIQQRVKKPQLMTESELIHYWAQQIWQYPHFIAYLKNHRALTEQIIRQYNLGLAKLEYNGEEQYFLSIPIPDNDGGIRNAKLRKLEKQGDSFVFANIVGKYVWFPRKLKETPTGTLFRPIVFPNIDATASQSNVIYFCTGELDALVLRGLGYTAFAGTRGENTFPTEFLDIAANKQVYLCPDNDEAGMAWLELAATKLSNVTEFIRVIVLPEGCKDITDLVVTKGHSGFIEAKNNAYNWQPSPDRLDLRMGVFIEGTSYCVINKRRVYPLSTFVFVPQILIHSENGDVIQGRLITPSRQYDNVQMPVSTITNKYEFNTYLSTISSEAVWSGNDRHMLMLRALWARTARINLVGTNKLGLNLVADASGEERWVFVLPNMTLPEAGVVFADPYNPPLYQISILLKDNFEETEELDGWLSDVLEIQPSSVILPLLAYFHACLLAPYVRKKTGMFPVLVATGLAGSGKTSTILEVLAPLIGMPSAGAIAARRTTASLRLQASQSNSYPLILDEFTPERYGDEIIKTAQELIHYCYNAYETSLAESAKKLAGKWSYTAPLVLIGESFVTDRRAIEERIIRVNFTHTIDHLPEQCIQAYDRASALVPIYAPIYAGLLHKFIIENVSNWDIWWTEVSELIESHIKARKEVVAYRQKLAMKVLALGFKVMKELAAHYNLKNVAEKLTWVNFVASLFFVNPLTVENLVEDLILGIDYLISLGVIGHDYDYLGGLLPKVYGTKKVIFFNLERIYNQFILHYRYRSAPPFRAYLSAINQEMGLPEPIVIDRHRRVTVYPKTFRIWAVILDYDRIKQRVSFPLFNIVEYMADKYANTPYAKIWRDELENIKKEMGDYEDGEEYQETLDILI